MQKQMKSLFVALVCMTIPVMAQKTDQTQSSEQTGWDIHSPVLVLRLALYR